MLLNQKYLHIPHGIPDLKPRFLETYDQSFRPRKCREKFTNQILIVLGSITKVNILFSELPNGLESKAILHESERTLWSLRNVFDDCRTQRMSERQPVGENSTHPAQLFPSRQLLRLVFLSRIPGTDARYQRARDM